MDRPPQRTTLFVNYNDPLGTEQPVWLNPSSLTPNLERSIDRPGPRWRPAARVSQLDANQLATIGLHHDAADLRKQAADSWGHSRAKPLPGGRAKPAKKAEDHNGYQEQRKRHQPRQPADPGHQQADETAQEQKKAEQIEPGDLARHWREGRSRSRWRRGRSPVLNQSAGHHHRRR